MSELSWRPSGGARTGQYLLIEADGGWNADLFDSLEEADVRSRIMEFARGWEVVQLQFERGVAGVTSTLRVYGRAKVGVYTQAAKEEVIAAMNSFWTVWGFHAKTVLVSDTLGIVESPGDLWGKRIDSLLLVLGLIAVAWIIFNIRKGID